MEWTKLGFEYLPTNAYAISDFSDCKWSKPELRTDFNINMHVGANCLHYGQACFEGLKVFRMKDGSAAMFRPEMNAARMRKSADRICMEQPPEDLFLECCEAAVRANPEFIPPYGTGATLYVRPLLIGTEPMVGVKISSTYSLMVLVTPVGPYYKDGFKPVESIIVENYDRTAPRGTGMAKVAGNYAASLKGSLEAKKKGYPIVLYLDSRENRFIDEFGTSNFIGITPDGKYMTPDSESILESITNASLRDLAADAGMEVVRCRIPVEDLEKFSEVGACGTAAVITPVHSIRRGERAWTFGEKDKAGKTLTSLYNKLRGIQYGEEEDTRGWMRKIEI